MHPQLHRKMRRFLTEPDQCKLSNEKHFKKLAIKEFKLNLEKRENVNELLVNNPHEEFTKLVKNQNVLPNAFKRSKPRHALFKLPGLSNQIDPNQQKLDIIQHHHPVFKRSNPLYIVNSLFQIMKEDISEQNGSLSHSKSNEHSKKEGSNMMQTINSNKNQFSQFQVNSIKVPRGPRLLDNQINRLTQNAIHSRRKIYSQEKSRIKQSQELITFYNCKQNSMNKKQSQMAHNYEEFKYSLK